MNSQVAEILITLQTANTAETMAISAGILAVIQDREEEEQFHLAVSVLSEFQNWAASLLSEMGQ